MKKKDLEKLKVLLIEDKKRLLRHLEDLSDTSLQGMQIDGGDPADIASLEISQASLQKIGKRESFLLRKIDYALVKVEDGTYGECESCGEDIAVKRLLARPVAQLCIDCKTEQENSERRFLDAKDREASDDVKVDDDDV